LRTIFLAVLCVASAVCAGAEQIEGVPFFRQERGQCGPSALASVMAYYGRQVEMSRVGRETYDDRLKGSLITDLENFAGRSGFQTESGQGTLGTIKDNIRMKRPIILLIDNGVWLAARPHYIVVFGFNDQGLITHDGKNASILFKYARFEKMWGKIGRPYLIIHP
jgi:ABC-type bacteriocin/lantibiotic exporter with double-glycine peptidase domain